MIKNTYDSLGRITGINHSSHNDKTLADYHYKWDAANRITEINDDKYGYDKTSQLLSAVYAKKPKEQYAYDLNGNRLNHRIGGNNQLLNDGKEEYQYDAEGNRISKGNTKYFWDHRNRLVKVISPSETIEYTYDYQNRLVKRSADKNTTHFIHDGWQIVRQYENGKPIKRFLWGTKQDELICDNDNWTLGDHLNTIREVVDTSGKTLAHCDYNAFGKCLSPLNGLSFAYTGKMTDSATGLQWNINRWYDANAGKWISEDPIGFKGNDTNLFLYAGNFSTFSVDIFGLEKKLLKDLCPEILTYITDIINNGILCQNDTAVTINQLLKHQYAIDNVFLKALNEQNATNANTSILWMLFGNLATANVISSTAVEAAVSAKITGIETVVHARDPVTKRFIKIPDATKNTLKTAAKAIVYTAIADWALSVLNNTLIVSATAQLTETTQAFSTSLQQVITARRTIFTRVVNETESAIRIHDSLYTVALDTQCCPLNIKTTKNRYDNSLSTFKRIIGENKSILKLVADAEAQLNDTLMKKRVL